MWLVEATGRAVAVKQHRHPRPFQQELHAYRHWLPRLRSSDAPPAPAATTSLQSREAAPALLALDSPAAPAPAPSAVPLAFGAATPALLAFDAPALALALSVSPGTRMSSGTADPALALAAHSAAGRFARALHDLPVADEDPLALVDAVSARLSEWHERARGLLSPAERDGLARLTRRRDAFAGVRRVPCHRDFTPDNWLFDGTCLHVLDFEHARLDAPEIDLVKLRAEVWPEHPALADAFLAGHGPLTTDAAARLDVLLALHAVATLAWAERHRDLAFHGLGRQALAVALASA